ncbi:hypothetical protein BWR15_25405 [Pseudomonas sp. T]|nr:hypothetical protein BWR15_25405 [Pseudomonas sp. T]
MVGELYPLILADLWSVLILGAGLDGQAQTAIDYLDDLAELHSLLRHRVVGKTGLGRAHGAA